MIDDRYTAENYFKEMLRILALQTRYNLQLTQREMSEGLHMCESSYSNIETGRCGCSMMTALLLLSMQANAGEYLRNLVKNFEKQYSEESVSI